MAILFFLFISSDMLNHRHPKMSDQIISNQNSLILVNRENFAPCLSFYEYLSDNGVEYKIIPIDPTYVQISVFQVFVKGINISGVEIPLTYHECSADDFEDYNMIPEYYLGNYCFDKKGEIFKLSSDLNSYFGNLIFFNITLQMCSNTTSNNNTCKPKDEILKYLNGKGIALQFTESYFNLDTL